MAEQQSLVARILEQQQQQSLTSQEVYQVSSSLKDDLVHRLVLAETLAQRTVQGTVTEAMKVQEKRLGLYVDAGLLGIDLGVMAEKRARGQMEESIVEEYYENLKLKKDDDGKASKPAHNRPRSAEPARKTPKSNEVTASVRTREAEIEDRLSAVGGIIRLATERAGSETETDESV